MNPDDIQIGELTVSLVSLNITATYSICGSVIREAGLVKLLLKREAVLIYDKFLRQL